MSIAAVRKVRTYKQWEMIRLTGRSGRKKVRRDTTLTRNENGALEFRYTGWSNKHNNKDELVVTLTPDDVYTISRDEANNYCPTYSNIIMLVVGIPSYSDMSHYKHYAQPVRISTTNQRFVKVEKTEGHVKRVTWERVKSMPFTNGLQFKDRVCLNPEIAIDYKRVLNREKSLPWLRKTVVLAKVLRVATRMGVLERITGKRFEMTFDMVNVEDPSAADAEIILHMGSAKGLYGWRAQNATPEEKQTALMRCAENGLADYREWLYTKHKCYEMVPVVYGTEPIVIGETS
jgi:hypothetical protein